MYLWVDMHYHLVGVSDMAKRVMGVLCKHAFGKYRAEANYCGDTIEAQAGWAWPSIAKIAFMAAISESSAKRALRELKSDEVGLTTLILKGGYVDGKTRPNIYDVNIEKMLTMLDDDWVPPKPKDGEPDEDGIATTRSGKRVQVGKHIEEVKAAAKAAVAAKKSTPEEKAARIAELKAKNESGLRTSLKPTPPPAKTPAPEVIPKPPAYVTPPEPKPTPKEIPFIYEFAEVRADSIATLEGALQATIKNPAMIDRTARKLTREQWDSLWVANLGTTYRQWKAADQAKRWAPEPEPPKKITTQWVGDDDLGEVPEYEPEESCEDNEELEGGVGLVRKRK